MPTVITVPIGERTKSVQQGAAYSPSLTFNPDKELQFGCSGILTGMGITVDTVPDPDQVTVDPGAFIQKGIIINISNAQVVEVPGSPTYPLFLVAENTNAVFNSNVQLLFTTSPSADSAIIAEWPAAPITSPEIPTKLSNCTLRDELDLIKNLVIQREEQTATGGQTIFTMPAGKEYVVGANKLSVYRNGKKMRVNAEYAETDTSTVTLNFGATAGDKLEFIIFQSEPPISSIALTDLTDVTGDLADAIKDSSALRDSPATTSNPLAAIADITTALTGAFTATTNFVRTAGNVTLADTASVMTDVTGPLDLVVNVAQAQTALLFVQASVGASNASGRASVALGIRLNGTPLLPGGNTVSGGLGGSSIIAGGFSTISTEGGGINNTSSDMSFAIPISLSSGANTIRLQYSKDSAGSTALLFADAASPLNMTCLHRA